MLATNQSERILAAEITRRREMLVNYLQTVLRPDDERLQRLLHDLREKSEAEGGPVPITH